FSRSSFFLYDTATIDIYTLSLHDALPIWTTMGDTAQQIIDLAEDAIATKGYSAFSFREIAALMGIKSASIHYHFPTKPHLGLAVASRYRQGYAAALADIDAQDLTPEAALASLVNIYRQQLGNGERMSVCMMLAAEIKLLPVEIQ